MKTGRDEDLCCTRIELMTSMTKKARGLYPAKDIELFSLHPFRDKLAFYLSFVNTVTRLTSILTLGRTLPTALLLGVHTHKEHPQKSKSSKQYEYLRLV